MPSQVDEIVKTLRRQEAELTSQAETLRSTLLETEKERKRVSRAIGLLAGGDAKNNGTKKRGCSTAAVLEAVTSVLSEHNSLPEEELKRLVKENLKSQGLSLTGVQLRLTKALTDESLKEEGGTYSLQTKGRVNAEPHRLAKPTSQTS